MNRRDFLQLTALAGSSLALSRFGLAQTASAKLDDINVAIVGVGRQGQVQLNHLLTQVAGVRVQAVCDIWDRGRQIGSRLCNLYKHPGRTYNDYHDLLAGERDLDAIVITVPDFVHHEIANACLEAGLHVYCEKEMSNDIEKARSMAHTAKRTGKLLQIGHQRRSSPAYLYTRELIHTYKLLGQLTGVSGQWNQKKHITPVPPQLVQKYPIEPSILAKYGYGSFAEFYYWRGFRKYCGGPMADLGTHQVDVFDWFLGALPHSIAAVGGNDYTRQQAKENNAGYLPDNFDHIQATYEWQTESGLLHGAYQVNETSSLGGIFESVMGEDASLRLSETDSDIVIDPEWSPRNTEPPAQGNFTPSQSGYDNPGREIQEILNRQLCEDCQFDIKGFAPLPSSPLVVKQILIHLAENMRRPPHVYHLENFFAAIRDKNVSLTCPAERGFETCVLTLKTDQAARAGEPLTLAPSDFVA